MKPALSPQPSAANLEKVFVERCALKTDRGFLLFELLIGMGILGITITALLWSLTEGTRSYHKLKTRLVAIQLLQERLESLDGRLNIKDLPLPIGLASASPYVLVPASEAKGEVGTEIGQLIPAASSAPYVSGGTQVALLEGLFEPPLQTFGFVERVSLVKPPDPANQKTRLVLYKVRVEVYWPVERHEVDSGGHLTFLDSTGMPLPAYHKEMLTASTVLLRAIP